MLRITNRTNNPVFIGGISLGINETIALTDGEIRFLLSSIKKLENSGIISCVSIEEKNNTVNQEATSLASETPKKRGRKSKKGES